VSATGQRQPWAGLERPRRPGRRPGRACLDAPCRRGVHMLPTAGRPTSQSGSAPALQTRARWAPCVMEAGPFALGGAATASLSTNDQPSRVFAKGSARHRAAAMRAFASPAPSRRPAPLAPSPACPALPGAVRRALLDARRRPAHQGPHHRAGQREAGRARGAVGAGVDHGQGPGAGRWVAWLVRHACPVELQADCARSGTGKRCAWSSCLRLPAASRAAALASLILTPLLVPFAPTPNPARQHMRWAIQNMSPRQCKWLVKIILRNLQARAYEGGVWFRAERAP
jgi:hypothetical protein